MKNRTAIAIMEKISEQYSHPADKRALDKAIAALEYCEKHKLTYYVRGKYFGKRSEE